MIFKITTTTTTQRQQRQRLTTSLGDCLGLLFLLRIHYNSGRCALYELGRPLRNLFANSFCLGAIKTNTAAASASRRRSCHREGPSFHVVTATAAHHRRRPSSVLCLPAGPKNATHFHHDGLGPDSVGLRFVTRQHHIIS